MNIARAFSPEVAAQPHIPQLKFRGFPCAGYKAPLAETNKFLAISTYVGRIGAEFLPAETEMSCWGCEEPQTGQSVGRRLAPPSAHMVDHILFFRKKCVSSIRGFAEGECLGSAAVKARENFQMLIRFGLRAFIIGAFLSLPAAAQVPVRVGSGETEIISAHGSCRVVTNNLPTDIAVPILNRGEWVGLQGFIQGADLSDIRLHSCPPSGGDATMCMTTAYTNDGGPGSPGCSNYAYPHSWRITKQSSAMPISTSMASAWEEAIQWARNNPGKTPDQRPSHILPACYKDSSLQEPSSRSDSVTFAPGDAYCIGGSSWNTWQNSSGGQVGGFGRRLYRIWR